MPDRYESVSATKLAYDFEIQRKRCSRNAIGQNVKNSQRRGLESSKSVRRARNITENWEK